MKACDVVFIACLKASLGLKKPKQRLRYLRAVSELLGDPAVVPHHGDRETARAVEEARALWAKTMPDLMGMG